MALALATVCTKKSGKKERKQVTECLQKMYQSVAIHLKDGLLVLFITSTKVFSLRDLRLVPN